MLLKVKIRLFLGRWIRGLSLICTAYLTSLLGSQGCDGVSNIRTALKRYTRQSDLDNCLLLA